MKKEQQLQNIKAEHKTHTQLKQAIDLEYTKLSKKKDKKDKSTIQDVFDPKTLKTLDKLYNNNIICQLNNVVISSGKEANVYYSQNVLNEENQQKIQEEYAVKIYKTMTMVFRDREGYISGEYRFKDKSKNKRTNEHKLIAAWAEKEMRNLKRIEKVQGIRVPKAIYLKENILVMEFIGKNKIAAKRLRDAKIAKEKIGEVYIEVIQIMRRLFIEAKLVHGDLSEYNMLYHNDELVLIDVSQSMENNHVLAIEYLKRDIYNINKYFGEQGVMIFSLREMFRYITDKSIENEQQEQQRIDEMIEKALNINTEEDRKEFESFMDVNIPQSLFELDIIDIERMIDERNKMKEMGLVEEMPIYYNLTVKIRKKYTKKKKKHQKLMKIHKTKTTYKRNK